MQTIQEQKGQKKFKKREGKPDAITNDFDVSRMSAEDARALFTKMSNMTSYASHFGSAPKAVEDFKILQKKKLSDLPISRILKPSVLRVFEHWLQINDQDEFTQKLFFTLREMNTVVSNQLAVVPEAMQMFSQRKTIQNS